VPSSTLKAFGPLLGTALNGKDHDLAAEAAREKEGGGFGFRGSGTRFVGSDFSLFGRPILRDIGYAVLQRRGEIAMSDGGAKQRRRIGADGPEVLAVGLGCMSLSGTYGPSDDAAAIPFLHRAIDLGVDFLDSSDAYGLGQNEELLGRALQGRRDKVVLATKFGQERRTGGVNGRPEYVQAACEASLKRLGVDHIDLYYQHRVDPNVPVEDTVGAMSRLVEQGKVRFLGLCEARPERIRRAHAVHPIAAVQSEYSLLYREVGEETRATTRDLGISFVGYSPLGRSLLAGVVPDFANFADGDTRKRHPRFEPENFRKNRALVERVEAIAADRRCTVAQLCLAWLLAQGPDVIPIPGTKRIERVEENLGALDIGLTPEEAAAIAEAVPPGAAAGLRYPAGGMAGVYI
jgi:aryl-alcohol dehydrogenase-like predicted oxidoreductase